MAPGPRLSFGLVQHKQRLILFGGVTDQASRGDKTYSEQHGDLYQFNLESRRWFPLALRLKGAAQLGTPTSTADASFDTDELPMPAIQLELIVN